MSSLLKKFIVRIVNTGTNRHISPEWESLKGKTVMNNTVEISGMGDIHPFKNGPIFDSETVYLTSCDKNFIYYWMNTRNFPKVKTLYLFSHPCEPDVMHRFPDTQIYLGESYLTYKKRWVNDLDNVVLHNPFRPDGESEPLIGKFNE